MVIDVIVLAGLYSLRIIAGAFLIKANPTFWLLAFSMFLFLSLALIKRFSELKLIKTSSRATDNNNSNYGRNYILEVQKGIGEE